MDYCLGKALESVPFVSDLQLYKICNFLSYGFIFFATKKAYRKSNKPHFTTFAEREGFEPPVGYPTTVFKTAAFDHSAISLCASAYPKRGAKVERKVIHATVEEKYFKQISL